MTTPPVISAPNIPPLNGSTPLVIAGGGATTYFQRAWIASIGAFNTIVAAINQLSAEIVALIPPAANPTGTIAGPVVNGTATTYMRSDAAPPLSLTGVAAGSYTGVLSITVDQWGRVTQILTGQVLIDDLGPVLDDEGVILVP